MKGKTTNESGPIGEKVVNSLGLYKFVDHVFMDNFLTLTICTAV